MIIDFDGNDDHSDWPTDWPLELLELGSGNNYNYLFIISIIDHFNHITYVTEEYVDWT